ncbi:Retrotransposon Copia-like N-terminal protein [Dioscorea alata]|uniref:Retrotransposon Copia-like N-terminal protein n=1 Tax=Dioscorea alata TaxID=55571 RepID=A0ACB7V120_DIOAL|nr:Retrotransposon Copia-like N-terminal protein [Dioscorea alata]
MVSETPGESSSISDSGGYEMLPKSPITFNHNISVKLDDDNFLRWKQQVLAVIKGHKLQSYIQGSKLVPQKFNSKEEEDLGAHNDDVYLNWEQREQLLLSLSDSIQAQMVGCEHSYQVWDKTDAYFTVHSRAKIKHIKAQMQTIKKGTLRASEYLK